jgi:methyl-accepting chemotaxis protein
VQHGAELVEQMRDALNQIIGRLDDTSSKAATSPASLNNNPKA